MSNYFCEVCFKTYSEYWGIKQNYLDQNKKNPVPKDHPLNTGICNNTDKTNPLIKGKICGGRLRVD